MKENMKDVILFGAPGCGKGTQADLLLQKIGANLSHLSTGDVFRAIIAHPNAIGNYVKNIMESGKLIDDNVTMSLFNAYFFTVLDQQKSMLLDGYPRSLVQMQGLEDMAKKHKRSVVGIHFVLSEEETIKRILARGRDGETQEVIRTRLQEYYAHTYPIIDAFKKRGQLIEVDANRTVEQIHTDVYKIVA